MINMRIEKVELYAKGIKRQENETFSLFFEKNRI